MASRDTDIGYAHIRVVTATNLEAVPLREPDYLECLSIGHAENLQHDVVPVCGSIELENLNLLILFPD